MTKYDFDINPSDDNAYGKILSKIIDGSRVLEFGCSTGYFTKILKEERLCKVDVVEIDEDALNNALQYSERGICSDIATLTWFDNLCGERYDCIIFADVLEHIRNPDVVLRESAKLLKENGIILISIPNITHNDIISKLISNHFDYTPLGLLDDTHVHFWGYDNISEFIQGTGLFVNKIEYVYVPSYYTEQYYGKIPKMDPTIVNGLRERDYGEVYQFVITASHNDISEVESVMLPHIKSHIYLDSGNGFNQKEMVGVDALKVDSGVFELDYKVKGNYRRIRIDPIEHQDCIIKIVRITQGETKLAPRFNEHFQLGEYVLLNSNDPQIVVGTDYHVDDEIHVTVRIVLPGEKYLKILKEYVVKVKRLLKEL